MRSLSSFEFPSGVRRLMHWQPSLSPTTLILLVTVYFAVVLNDSFWQLVTSRLQRDLGGSPLLATQMAFFLGGLTLLVLAIVRFPYVLKPVVIVLLVLGAGAAYFMDSYGVMIDAEMLRNAVQTDSAETTSLLNGKLALYLGCFGLVPALLVFRAKIHWASPWRNLFQTAALVSLAVILTIASVAVQYKAAAPFVRSNGKQMRLKANPLNLIQAGVKLTRQSGYLTQTQAYQPIAEYVRLRPGPGTSAPPLLVLVVGETARAMNFSLNGYSRKTNPQLEELPVISFSQVASCGTATAISLPCMFSNLDRTDYSATKVFNRENLLDLAKRAGYRVLWIDNQAGSKGVSERVETRQLQGNGNGQFEVSDSAFIDAFERELAEPAVPTLLVFHQMGSHGPEYFKRSQEQHKHFRPECKEKQFDQCEAQSIQNAYDNTIVETDNLLAGLIHKAAEQRQTRPVSLLYISDHGESLGENGLYLHGMPYVFSPAEQTSVPMIYWSNALARIATAVPDECAAQQRDRPLSQDNYFDTVLGLLNIDSDAYTKSKDIFGACRPANSPGVPANLDEALLRFTPAG